jgi:hypothetical protein
MRRFIVVASMLVVATGVLLAPSTAAAATTTAAGAPAINCADIGVQRWCNASSVNYPNTRGWFGFVGKSGGPCGPNPRGTTFPDTAVGLCVMPAPIPLWRYTSSGWRSASLDVGTRGYVHPFDSTWRWLYVESSWYAIRAQDLTLEWRVR